MRVGHAHVVGRGGVHDDGRVRHDAPRRDPRAAQIDLLLHGEHAGHVALIAAFAQHVQQDHAARAVVERLRLHKAVAKLTVFAFKRRVAAGRAKALGLGLVLCADIDEDVRKVRRLLSVLRAHQVDGLHADHARHGPLAHDHALGDGAPGIDPADAVDAQQAVLPGKADDEADLVHVRRQQDVRQRAVCALAECVEVAHRIAVHAAFPVLENVLRLAADGVSRLVLPAGGSAQRRDVAQKHSVSSQPS